MADQINIHVTYEVTKRVIPCPKGEVVQGFAILFLQAFSDVLPREVEPSDVKFQLYVETFDEYVDLQGNEPLKDGMKLRALILGQVKKALSIIISLFLINDKSRRHVCYTSNISMRVIGNAWTNLNVGKVVV